MQGSLSYSPMTKSLPSTRPAETNSWETPSAESEDTSEKINHKQSSETRVEEHEREEIALWIFLPLPGMNSNLMSLSSFLEFLNLRTRLMGTLDEAAGSYQRKIVKDLRLGTRVFVLELSHSQAWVSTSLAQQGDYNSPSKTVLKMHLVWRKLHHVSLKRM